MIALLLAAKILAQLAGDPTKVRMRVWESAIISLVTGQGSGLGDSLISFLYSVS